MRATYLLFLLFPLLTSGQSYTPMAVEGAQWVMYKNAEADSNKTLFGYIIRGDSTIQGKSYKKVFYREFVYNGGSIVPPYELEGEEFYALIRDDISSRKVYAIGAEYYDPNQFCRQDTIQEKLWYDFSKEVGDTLIDQCVYPASREGAIILDSITTNTYYGFDRRTYYGYVWLDSNSKSSVDPYIIEGIGSHRGLFDPAVGEEYIPSAALDLVDYCIGSDADCQIITSTRMPDVIEHSVYPNPVGDLLQLRLGPNVEYPLILHIYDPLGKNVKSQEIAVDQTEISLDNLMPGLYSYVLYREGQKMARGKFMKM